MPMVKRRGPWSSSEDQRLVTFIKDDPTLNWVNISMQVESRTPKQCRERYHQNLKKSLNHSPITTAEGAQINAFVQKHGKRWADIARQLNGRSDNAVKNWWNGNQNRIKRAEQRRRATVDPSAPGVGSAMSSPASTHALPQPCPQPCPQLQLPPFDRPTTHRRNVSGTIQDLADAATLHRRDYYHQSQPSQAYGSVYAARGRESSPREREHVPYYQSEHRVREPQFAHYAPAQHTTIQHTPVQQASAQQYPTQYAQPFNGYQYPPGPPSAGLDSLYHQARRPSIYADSPGADSVDHGSAPSLVSDHGSPSVRGSSSHAWPSPTLELPPLLNINGSVSKSNAHLANSPPSTQFALPDYDRPSFERPSSEQPTSASVYSYSTPSPDRTEEDFENSPARTHQLTASAEEAAQAAEVIMNLPKGDGKKRGGLGVSDLLN
ncbi:myb-like DNA-binding protein [Grosmannia clavigera kw1407]|uniref:Myb-like DNA-binding protein n=1 Tax=Grosmannia clavigera (strain kw1407 / UAMH 11150) TaxID=655863 RepID=F0XMC7_GROCL|nr:myb-like DNA-binding protein [Grosmannia clavigera kw1407]EFX01333.1 myb-like DNA-binding protein [Grosmannia clavigera kw1407]